MRVATGWHFAPFWKLVAKNPEKAFAWFLEEDCWEVFWEKHKLREFLASTEDDYRGPFFVAVPSIGETVFIVGIASEIEDPQAPFMSALERAGQ